MLDDLIYEAAVPRYPESTEHYALGPFYDRENDHLVIGFLDNRILSLWAAVYALLIVWALLLIAKYIAFAIAFNAGRRGHILLPTAEPAVTRASVEETARYGSAGLSHEEEMALKSMGWAPRISKAMKIARDGLIMLTIATLITHLGTYGSSFAAVILGWIFFALMLVWVVAELTDLANPLVRSVVGLLSFPLIAVIMGLAFRRFASDDTRRRGPWWTYRIDEPAYLTPPQ